MHGESDADVVIAAPKQLPATASPGSTTGDPSGGTPNSPSGGTPGSTTAPQPTAGQATAAQPTKGQAGHPAGPADIPSIVRTFSRPWSRS